ncbi:hypothetical protein NE236_39285 [Actinoallomurus purpureus]|uniref:hypothetical protein n=1 Tax=Actinoallomurus purpureus TaxID=478114 RepID=UPI002092D263|nr:hypothetical protein [Actinoallomurus purpureus]MCO6011017.1 hypothetical protein [Actinoallomurus purpureus]
MIPFAVFEADGDADALGDAVAVGDGLAVAVEVAVTDGLGVGVARLDLPAMTARGPW